MQRKIIGGFFFLTALLSGCTAYTVQVHDGYGYHDANSHSCGGHPCGERLYDINWLRCSDYPVDYRAAYSEYIPARTRYIHQPVEMVPNRGMVFESGY